MNSEVIKYPSELKEEVLLDKIRELNKNDKIVIIMPDHGSRYLAKVYNDEWMRKQNFI